MTSFTYPYAIAVRVTFHIPVIRAKIGLKKDIECYRKYSKGAFEEIRSLVMFFTKNIK